MSTTSNTQFPKFVSESRGGSTNSTTGNGSNQGTNDVGASGGSQGTQTAGAPTPSVGGSNTSNTNSTTNSNNTNSGSTAGTSSTPSPAAGSSASSSTTTSVPSSSSSKGPLPPPPPPPLNLCIVINICHYLTPLSKLIILSQPLDTTSGEAEREAFLALQNILTVLDTGKNEPINVFPFLDKFCRYIGTGFSDFEEMDIFLVWDYAVKLITLVIPPLREIFMGRLSLSLDEQAWHTLTTRCIHAQFSSNCQSLDEFIKTSLTNFDKEYYNELDLYQHKTSLESVKNFNSIMLGRSPDILAFAVESAHLPASLRFLDALSKNPSKIKPPSTIKFPSSFSLSKDVNGQVTSREETGESGNGSSGNGGSSGNVTVTAASSSGNISMYDLAAVVTLEGTNCDIAQAYYRYVMIDPITGLSSNDTPQAQWYKGSGATHDLVEANKAIEKNYFHASDTKKIHPRLLIYTKRGIHTILDSLKDFVTKGGQLRCKGDQTFDNAETPEHYDEAKQYYEDAISYDENLRSILQERLHSLEQIERNQKAQSYENQADLSLGKRRFKEACDLYKLAMRSAVTNSHIYNRIREKEDYMMRIISLEIANHLTEKGEDCLKNGSYQQSRENFAQALKLNPNYIHLQSIIQGIDKLITQQTSAQKVSEANQAMKVGRYKYANTLYLEAVALVPDRESTLKPVLESLIVLMQGEDALMKQRSGLVALEDKKYSHAISLITEAITLLPTESIAEHAFFLCDRAQVYFEMKDYHTAIVDCHEALKLRPDLAMAYLRLGSAQFELELFDDALISYEKAMRSDSSLNDQVKVKIRQVNTAKEVQQRKERELERARIKEEEQRKLEEKRAKIERERKEKAEKAIQEQAEKAERNLMKEEEKRTRAIMQRDDPDAAPVATGKGAKGKDSAKDAKAKLKEKAEKEAQKAAEKERVKAEKEKERERVKAEKEAKLREEQAAKEEELRRQREFAAEMERAAQVLKDAEKEKELERERARLERERILAEKEKIKAEKAKENKKKQAAATTPVIEPKKADVVPSPVAPVTAASVVAGSLNTKTTIPSKPVVSAAPASSGGADFPDFPTLGSAKKEPITPGGKGKQPSSGAPAGKGWASLLSTGNTNASGMTSDDDFVALSAAVAAATPTSPPPLGANNSGKGVRPITILKKPTVTQAPSDFPIMDEGPGSSSTSVASGSPLDFNTTNSVAASLGLLDSRTTPDVLSSGEMKSLIKQPIVEVPGVKLTPRIANSLGVTGGGVIASSGLGSGSVSRVPSTTPDLNNTLHGSSVSGNTSSNNLHAHHPPIPVASRDTSSSIQPTDDSTFPQSAMYSPMNTLRPAATPNPVPTGLDSLLSSTASNSAPFPALGGLSRNASSTLDHPGIGSLTSAFADLSTPSVSSGAGLSSLSGLGGTEGTSTGGGLFDNFGAPTAFSRGVSSSSLGGLGNLGVDNNSRLSSLFGPSDLGGLGGGSDVLGGSLFGGSSSTDANKDPLASVFGNDSFGLSSSSLGNYGFGGSNSLGLGSSSLGGSSLSGGLGSSGLGGDLFGGSLGGGLLGGSGATGQESRLDKLLGAFDSPSDPFSKFSFGSSTSSSVAPPSLVPPTATTTAETGLWADPNPLSANATPFTLPSMAAATPSSAVSGSSSSAYPTKRLDLFDLGKGLDEVKVNDTVQYSGLMKLHPLGITLHHWVFDGVNSEWLENAFYIPDTISRALKLDDHSGLNELSARYPQCDFRLVDSTIRTGSMKEKFLVVTVKGTKAAIDALIQATVNIPPSTPGSVNKWASLVASPPVATTAPSVKEFAVADSMIDSLIASVPTANTGATGSSSASVASDSPVTVGIKLKDRPPLLKLTPHPTGQVRRYVEIPAELIGLVIGHGGRKIKDLSTDSGSRIQFKTSKTSEREGKPGVLEVQGSAESVDKALQMVWELLQSVGREYREVTGLQSTSTPGGPSSSTPLGKSNR